jgi:tRNA threonylcarbamoyladenosine biosynthesis protein TsaB
MLLAIDTATQWISLALHDGDNLVAEQTWHTANNHTIELAPAVSSLLARHTLTVEGLEALAVCVGPGTYTGLRIGVALAKGLAAVRGLPVFGMSTLDILASAQPQMTGGLVATVAAGRGRIITSTYQWRKGRWNRRGEPQLMDWETLISSIDGPATVTGEIDTAGHAALQTAQASGVPVSLAPSAYRLRRAGFLAHEAWARLRESHDGLDADRIVPVYVKTKDVP